jgi:DNA-binding response OmpR family regulator
MGTAALRVFSGEDEPGGKPRESPRPQLAVAREPDEAPGAAPSPSVLLVEDDEAMRFLCAFNLEVEGFRVTSAATGQEALERARAERFDLLLVDVMLPDVGGFELVQQLRDLGAPVVFISARTSAADLARGRAAGAIDYVTKPFDPVELSARLREDLEVFADGGAARVWQLRFGAA